MGILLRAHVLGQRSDQPRGGPLFTKTYGPASPLGERPESPGFISFFISLPFIFSFICGYFLFSLLVATKHNL
jgi:hypothetical protein